MKSDKTILNEIVRADKRLDKTSIVPFYYTPERRKKVMHKPEQDLINEYKKLRRFFLSDKYQFTIISSSGEKSILDDDKLAGIATSIWYDHISYGDIRDIIFQIMEDINILYFLNYYIHICTDQSGLFAVQKVVFCYIDLDRRYREKSVDIFTGFDFSSFMDSFDDKSFTFDFSSHYYSPLNVFADSMDIGLKDSISVWAFVNGRTADDYIRNNFDCKDLTPEDIHDIASDVENEILNPHHKINRRYIDYYIRHFMKLIKDFNEM